MGSFISRVLHSRFPATLSRLLPRSERLGSLPCSYKAMLSTKPWGVGEGMQERVSRGSVGSLPNVQGYKRHVFEEIQWLSMYHCTVLRIRKRAARVNWQLHMPVKTYSVVMSTFVNVTCRILQHDTAEFGQLNGPRLETCDA